ncbi:MAG: coenzyme F420-0:L-glutamate ligase [Candidatus Heimdallarchaeaceae archaeon]
MVRKISRVELIPLKLPIIQLGDDISKLIIDSLNDENLTMEDGDILVIAHTIISRAEGNEFFIPSLHSSPFAELIARKTGKDPALVQLIVDEAEKILKVQNSMIITKTKHGWICANSAIDQSNSQPNCAVSLPDDSNASAERIGKTLANLIGKQIAIIVSDTHGRALRRGAINIAIGAFNFPVIDDVRGRRDIFGYELTSTIVALADEVSSAAELVMGQAGEMIPVVIVRGLEFKSPVASIFELQFDDDRRLFK